jgi:hypothetical protein
VVDGEGEAEALGGASAAVDEDGMSAETSGETWVSLP